MHCEVREYQGRPTLFIDAAPQPGLIFYTNTPRGAEQQIAEFAAQAIHTFTFPVPDFWLGPATYDFSQLDLQLRALLAADPRARCLLRINLDPPPWWRTQYPEEMRRHWAPDGRIVPETSGGAAFASQRWQADTMAAVRALLTHCETHYTEQVIGYHPGAAGSFEWSYSWHFTQSDFSAPQEQAFRQWLRTRYAGRVEALRAAWQAPDVTFENAAISRTRLRQPAQTCLFDPHTERASIDYLEFHSWQVAEAALYFCREIKAALSAAGRRKLVGLFYGYRFFCLPSGKHYQNAGHNALARILAAPEVDFLSSPYTYYERHAGGIFLSQAIAGSIRRHGKLNFMEDDTRTSLTPPRVCVGRCPDLRRTRGVLQRNAMAALAQGAQLWWMEHGRGWFSDPELLADIGRMSRLWSQQLQEPWVSAAQIAVIVSEQSAWHLRQDDALSDTMVSNQMAAITRIGAQADVFLADDLELVFGQGQGQQYRLVIFLDAFYLTPAQRTAIRQLVARAGRTLLWMYGAGLATENGLAPEAQSALTGIGVRLSPLPATLHVATDVTGTRLLYGTERRMGPILYGDDPQAEVLGWLQAIPGSWIDSINQIVVDYPGLLARAFADWRSIVSHAPGMPAAVLRALALQAGVHIFASTGDQVSASANLLALHAWSDGPRQLHFPAEVDLYEPFSGASLARACQTFTVTLQRGDTFSVRYTRPRTATLGSD